MADRHRQGRLVTTIATAAAAVDQLIGDLQATTFLLDCATAERDTLARRVAQLEGEIADLRAGLSWRTRC